MADHANAGDSKEIQIPEWDNNAVNQSKDGNGAATTPQRAFRQGFSSRLDSVMPPHKRYLGLSRKIFLMALLAVLLALLALIIGLAVGLTEHSQYDLRTQMLEATLTFPQAQ